MQSKGLSIVFSNISSKAYYSSIKNEIMPFTATWLDLEIITLSEASQTEKDKYPVIPRYM